MAGITTFTFNGRSSSEFSWLVVNRVNEPLLPEIENIFVEIPGRPGVVHAGQKIKQRILSIQVTIIADTWDELEQRKDELKTWLRTTEVKPLSFSYRPNREYMAILDGSTDIDKVGLDGELELTFVCPDPYAYGLEHSKTIAGIPTITNDTDTQAEWNTGTLTNVIATTSGLELAKEGSDYNNTVNSWVSGTHNQTKESNGKLVLDSTSTPTNTSYTDDWTGGTNTNVAPSGGKLGMTNLPAWDEIDTMSNWASTGWDGSRLATPFTQTADGARAECSGTSAALVKEYPGQQFPITIEFVYRLNPPTNPQSGWNNRASVYLIEERGGTKYRFSISLYEATSWTWVRIVLTSATAGDVYINGVYDRSFSGPVTTSLSPRIQFIIDDALQQQGILEITQYHKKNGTLHSQVPSFTFPYTGTRVTPEIDLSSLGTYSSSSISFNATTPTGFNGFNSTAKLEADVFKGGSWKGYQQVNNGGSLPHLTSGESLNGVKVRLRETLTTYDVQNKPTINTAGFTVNGQVFSYVTSGNYVTAADSGIQAVGKARQATISWVENKPAGTNIRVYTSLDGVSYQEVTNGGNIPQINPSVDLTGKSLYTKFELSTTDTTKTPEITSLTYSLLSAWKTSGERISTGVALGSLQTAGESTLITWDTTPDASPDVKVYTQIVDDGFSPTPEGWLEAANGQPIPGISEGMSLVGKNLYTRQVLSGNGSSTPILHRQLWQVWGPGGNTINYQGTEKAFPVMTVNFTANCDTFEILHYETGRRLYFWRSFTTGDELIINNKNGKITINGAVDMTALSLSSDWIYLQPGTNTLITTPENSCTVVVDWRDKYL